MKTQRLLGLVVVLAWSAVAHAQSADLRAEMTAPDQVDADTDVTFALTVTNGGADDSADASFNDPLPSGMTFVSLSSPGGWTCTTPAVGTHGAVSCSNTLLAADAEAMFTIVAHIDPGTAPGTFLTNIATASSSTTPDPTAENDSAVATVQTPPPPPADVMVTVQGPSATNADTDVTYVIEVSNPGPNAATNVALSAPIPGDLAIVSLVQDSGPTFSCSTAGPITCSLMTLPGGTQATFTIIGHVPNTASDGATYQLIATVTSDADPTSENDEAPTLFCVQANQCDAGPCNANHAVVCPTATACHDQGTCNPLNGVCSENTPQTGTSCDDSDGCTQTDTCNAGACEGSDPVVCTVATQCQVQGTCDPGTGTCGANTDKLDGTVCNDGDACTQTDECQSGACTGSDPVVCAPANDCEDPGTCNSANGTCSHPHKTDGTRCDDGDACTGASSCNDGACVGSDPVVCPAAGQCEHQGTCDPATGECAANTPKTDGSGCDDGDACTDDDACMNGSCNGSARSCDDGNACTTDSCDTEHGCQNVATCSDDAGEPPAPDAGAPIAGSSGGEHDAGSKPHADAGHGNAGRGGSAGEDESDAGEEEQGGPDDDKGCSCRIGAGAEHGSQTAPIAGLLLLAVTLGRRFRRRNPRR